MFERTIDKIETVQFLTELLCPKSNLLNHLIMNDKIFFNLLFSTVLILMVSLKTPLKGQHQDCFQAFPICSYGNYYSPEVEGKGIDEIGVEIHLDFKETNSHWISWEVEDDGLMDFIIIPDSMEDDLDFLLFKSPSNCSSKELVRTMLTGPEKSNPQNISWQGETGLTQSSEDLFEEAGYINGDNNFLKSIEVSQDEKYYLLVNNFNSTKGFNIYFEGTAVLKDCSLANSLKRSNWNVRAFPNPASDKFYLDFLDASQGDYVISFFDGSAKLVKEEIISIDQSNTSSISVSIDQFKSGNYFIRITNEQESTLLKMVKI